MRGPRRLRRLLTCTFETASSVVSNLRSIYQWLSALPVLCLARFLHSCTRVFTFTITSTVPKYKGLKFLVLHGNFQNSMPSRLLIFNIWKFHAIPECPCFLQMFLTVTIEIEDLRNAMKLTTTCCRFHLHRPAADLPHDPRSSDVVLHPGSPPFRMDPHISVHHGGDHVHHDHHSSARSVLLDVQCHEIRPLARLRCKWV